MDGYDSIIATIAERAAENARAEPGDYCVDGLLQCGRCNTPKQARVVFGGKTVVVGCMCRCKSQRWKQEQEAARESEARTRAEMLRSVGIQDALLQDIRFDSLESTQELEVCRKYTDRWDDMRRENIGLLLWGQTGNGKTAAAACIANALIDRGIPVLFTSLPRILCADFASRAEAVRQMQTYPLAVLDDLGAERHTEYSLEVLYATVNERYKAGKPMVITTNTPLQELKHPRDGTMQRIYERVLEMCIPVAFRGASRRSDYASRKSRVARELMA